MAQSVKIWFDKEGDFLEVLFSDRPGYMRETANDAVMERVDESGRLPPGPPASTAGGVLPNQN